MKGGNALIAVLRCLHGDARWLPTGLITFRFCLATTLHFVTPKHIRDLDPDLGISNNWQAPRSTKNVYMWHRSYVKDTSSYQRDVEKGLGVRGWVHHVIQVNRYVGTYDKTANRVLTSKLRWSSPTLITAVQVQLKESESA